MIPWLTFTVYEVEQDWVPNVSVV